MAVIAILNRPWRVVVVSQNGNALTRTVGTLISD
jgi:hypothetical protein